MEIQKPKITTEETLKQITTPSNPSSGYNKLYFKNDNLLYKLTSAGVESSIGGSPQTPWTSDIDGGGFNLSNVHNLTTTNYLRVYNMAPPVPVVTMTSATTPSPYVASASSEYSPSYSGWRAFNSGVGEWATAGVSSNFWVEIDLGSIYYADSATVSGRGGGESPNNWRIEGSNNNSTWTTLYSQASLMASTNTLVVFSAPGAYRYYRMFAVTGSGTNNGMAQFLLGVVNPPSEAYIQAGGNSYLIGNLGIGINSPGAQFHVKTLSASSIGEIIQGMPSQTADYLQILKSTGSKVLGVATNGRVNIGETDRDGSLGIFSNAGVGSQIFDMTNNADANIQIRVTTSGSADKYALISPSTNTGLAFGTNTTEYMRIAAGGNIGIGVTTPLAFLQIKAPTTAKSTLNLMPSSSVNPSAPNSGDMWWNGTNLYFYNGSTNKDLLAGGGGGPQTPWASDIDGAQYSLLNVGHVEIGGQITSSALENVTNNFAYDPTGFSAALVMGTYYTAPTSDSISFLYGPNDSSGGSGSQNTGGNVYTANGQTILATVYTYTTIGGINYTSPNGVQLSFTDTINDGYTQFSVNWSWSSATNGDGSGISGYTIQVPGGLQDNGGSTSYDDNNPPNGGSSYTPFGGITGVTGFNFGYYNSDGSAFSPSSSFGLVNPTYPSAHFWISHQVSGEQGAFTRLVDTAHGGAYDDYSAGGQFYQTSMWGGSSTPEPVLIQSNGATWNRDYKLYNIYLNGYNTYSVNYLSASVADPNDGNWYYNSLFASGSFTGTYKVLQNINGAGFNSARIVGSSFTDDVNADWGVPTTVTPAFAIKPTAIFENGNTQSYTWPSFSPYFGASTPQIIVKAPEPVIRLLDNNSNNLGEISYDKTNSIMTVIPQDYYGTFGIRNNTYNYTPVKLGLTTYFDFTHGGGSFRIDQTYNTFFEIGANAISIKASNIGIAVSGVGVTLTGAGLAIQTSTVGFFSHSGAYQPTTGIGGASFTANSGTTVNSASTFGGYTIAQIVAGLQSLGLLA